MKIIIYIILYFVFGFACSALSGAYLRIAYPELTMEQAKRWSDLDDRRQEKWLRPLDRGFFMRAIIGTLVIWTLWPIDLYCTIRNHDKVLEETGENVQD